MTRRGSIRNDSAPEATPDDQSSAHRHYGKAILGLGALAAGVLMTLDNLDIVETDHYLDFWPVLVILLGIAHLVQPPPGRRLVSGAIWILVGVILLLYMLDLVNFNPFDLWPLVLVLAGCSMLARAFRRGRPVPADVANTFDAIAVMGGVQRRITSDNFQGGDATALLGGCEIDLRDAGSGGGPAEIHCFAFWGGVDVKVPEDWEVQVRGIAILGGFEDKTATQPGEGSKVLVISGMAIMGGVEVKS